ncbi:MAG: hypothetical protein HN389_07760 [Clostridia bacterium]|nr:hypothetical protein [Clostridia bacterium]
MKRKISRSIKGAAAIAILLGVLGAAAAIVPAIANNEGYFLGIVLSVTLILGFYIIHVVLRGFAVIVENYEKPESEEKPEQQKSTKSVT